MPTECYRVQIEGHANGYHWQNVLHFLCDNNNDATPIACASELIGKLASEFASSWVVFNSQQTLIQWMSAKRILPAGGNSYWKEFPEASLKGTIEQEVASVSLAPILKLYGGLTSGLQGRIFLPPPPEDEVEENSISTTYHNNVISWFEDIDSFTEDHDWNMAIYSRKNNTAVSVTTCTVSPILGQLRRRRQPL